MRILVKSTIWEEFFTDSSLEEVKEFLLKNHPFELVAEKEFYNNELLLETQEFISPEKNEGFSTIEIYNEENNLVYKNGK